jgi:hypothetical protein
MLSFAAKGLPYKSIGTPQHGQGGFSLAVCLDDVDDNQTAG